MANRDLRFGISGGKHDMLDYCFTLHVTWRQCNPVVRALALRSRDRGFKSRSGHWLKFFLVVPGTTSQLYL